MAPHNLSFNKHAVSTSNKNHSQVIGNLETILSRHRAIEDKKMKGLSEEMAAQKKSKKSGEVLRTEAFLNQLNQNFGGQQVNGRKLNQPDLKLYQKI